MSYNSKQTKKPNTIAKPPNRIKGSLSLTTEENVKKKKNFCLSKTFAYPQSQPNHKRNNSFLENKPPLTQKVKTRQQKQQQQQQYQQSNSLTKNDDLNQEFTFADTFNIISEIQYQFENSLKENKKPISEIKRLIDNDLNIYNYVFLSQEQKDNITKDIERSSELRIQNYANVFKYIQSSLEGIDDCLQKMVNQEENFDEEYGNIEDDDDNEMIETSEDFVASPEPNKKVKREAKEKSHKINGNNCDLEESDFSAGIMLENALVLPPKSSPFNYQCGKDITRMRGKKSSEKNQMAMSCINQTIKNSIFSPTNNNNIHSHSHINSITNSTPINTSTNINDKKNTKEDETIEVKELQMLASSVEKIDQIEKEKGCYII